MRKIAPALGTMLRGEKSIFISAVVIFIGFSLLSPRFLQHENLLDIVRLMSITMIIAIGMTMVIIIGEIDLSVGSLSALAGMVFGHFFVNLGINPVLAALMAIAVGALSGFVIALLRNVYLSLLHLLRCRRRG